MSTKGVLRGLYFHKRYPRANWYGLSRELCLMLPLTNVAVARLMVSGSEGLSEENNKQFYISEGFAHGFLVLSDVAKFCYKVTDFYHLDAKGGLVWNDTALGIHWPKLEAIYNRTASAEEYTVDGVPLNLSKKGQKWLGPKNTFKF